MRPGMTIPPIDLLAPLPAVAQAGSCLATDRRGTERYIYVLVPTGAATATFWRYDTRMNVYQQLATPTLGANSVIGVGTALIVDESTNSVWLFNAESATAGGTEWARFQRYDPATNTWTARTVLTLALAAQWATDACLAHPDSSLSSEWTAQNDFIYLIGNGVVRLHRYSIAGNAWASLDGAGGARAGAPGAGATLDVIVPHPDRIYSLRGGGSAVLDRYTISTDTWATVAIVPNTETFGAGTESSYMVTPGNTIQVHQAGRIININPGSLETSPAGRIYGDDGAAHVGRGIVSYYVDGQYYLVLRPHGKAELQRISLVS